MYMEKLTNVIEIKNKSIRVLIGYLIENKLKAVYAKKFKLSVPLNDADVLDVGSITLDLEKIKNINDQDLNFKYTIRNAILVLPSFGLEVYNASKTTNVVNYDRGINEIDVRNVVSLFENESISPMIQIVNVIPNSFSIDNGESFSKSPLGVKTRKLTLDAYVYTLPFKMVDDLSRAMLNANIKIDNILISSVSSSNYLKNINFKYNTYILIDIGSKNTFVTVIKNSIVQVSTFFDLGGDTLTKNIANELNISFEDAEKLKIIYGLDNSANTFNAPICKSIKDGTYVKYTKIDINKVVNNFLHEFNDYLLNSIKNLLKDNQEFISRIPLIFKGSTIKLNGFKESVSKNFYTNTLEFNVSENVVGAPFIQYGDLLGAIYLDKELESNYKDVSQTLVNDNVTSSLRREGDN